MTNAWSYAREHSQFWLTDELFKKQIQLKDLRRILKMSISGIGTSNYITGYATKRAVRNTPANNFENTINSQNSNGVFTLHYFDNEDGDTALGACCNNSGSVTVYKPKDFDPSNPMYKVREWDSNGNMTERMTNVLKVDPRNADFCDMYAYSCYLTDSGAYPDAQDVFMRARGFYTNDNLSAATNWLNVIKTAMQTQYDAGNMIGYFDYKRFFDFLKK